MTIQRTIKKEWSIFEIAHAAQWLHEQACRDRNHTPPELGPMTELFCHMSVHHLYHVKSIALTALQRDALEDYTAYCKVQQGRSVPPALSKTVDLNAGNGDSVENRL